MSKLKSTDHSGDENKIWPKETSPYLKYLTHLQRIRANPVLGPKCMLPYMKKGV